MNPPPDRRVAVRVTKDALRRIRSGHPWLFDRSIVSFSHDGAPGDLAIVFDDRRAFVGVGLLDPASPIRVRLLHVGKPKSIDAAFWADKIEVAAAGRAVLVDTQHDDAPTTGYRLINGENDGFGGLIVDRYGMVLVLKVYSAAWLPHLPVLVELLAMQPGVEAVVFRSSRNTAAAARGQGLADGRVLVGAIADPVLFTENGLVFEAATRTGQKTGHFLDQRENRWLVGERSRGSSVLDVFSCTGGFATHAAAGGASSVQLVDLNPYALEAARRNLGHNAERADVGRCSVETTTGDAFAVLERLVRERRSYGVVVIDPPSFASRADQTVGAIRAYRRLTDLAVRLVEPGGWFFQASCSSRVDRDTFVETVGNVAAGLGRPLQDALVTGHALDHPVTFPEGAYLKAVLARV